MLNPSTADAERDDPTIRRCIGFSRAWGFGGAEMVNLFALRSTDPGRLREAADPVGPGNVAHIADAARGATQVIAAWGAFPLAAEQGTELVVEATGEDAQAAVDALAELIARQFDEESEEG